MCDAPERIWARENMFINGHGTYQTRGSEHEYTEYVRADTITALEEENKRLREAMERAARYADGIRGAVETNQVADKDVRGVAILIRNNLRAALEGE